MQRYIKFLTYRKNTNRLLLYLTIQISRFRAHGIPFAEFGGVEARFAVEVAAEGGLVGEGQWEAVTNREFQDYFVDGTLLATRWKNQGEEELREWWEIASIAGNEMQWTALRAAEGGTMVQTMKWVKVN